MIKDTCASCGLLCDLVDALPEEKQKRYNHDGNYCYTCIAKINKNHEHQYDKKTPTKTKEQRMFIFRVEKELGIL